MWQMQWMPLFFKCLCSIIDSQAAQCQKQVVITKRGKKARKCILNCEIQVDCDRVKTMKSQCVFCFFFYSSIFFLRFWYWTKQQPPSTLRQIFSFRRPFAARLAAAPPSSSPIVWTPWWAAAGSWSWTTARCVERQHEWLRDCTIRRLNWNSFPSWYPPDELCELVPLRWRIG